jgi:dienelactone hydrolase
MSWEDALSAYDRFDFQDGPWTRPVWRRGTGPAVIIIHEIPGLHPLVIRFADRVAEAGMTVFLPSLIGDPGRPRGRRERTASREERKNKHLPSVMQGSTEPLDRCGAHPARRKGGEGPLALSRG